ncbi:hypothetical protein AAG570_012090 [Ranatra chinensis]|uniref:Uncharacterized protein n=1 Tax=Ranatra chinensis TaxID=642074 RepID=A0ABD0YJV7_9HEMI
METRWRDFNTTTDDGEHQKPGGGGPLAYSPTETTQPIKPVVLLLFTCSISRLDIVSKHRNMFGKNSQRGKRRNNTRGVGGSREGFQFWVTVAGSDFSLSLLEVKTEKERGGMGEKERRFRRAEGEGEPRRIGEDGMKGGRRMREEWGAEQGRDGMWDDEERRMEERWKRRAKGGGEE